MGKKTHGWLITDAAYRITVVLLRSVGIVCILLIAIAILMFYIGVILWTIAWCMGIIVSLLGVLYVHFQFARRKGLLQYQKHSSRYSFYRYLTEVWIARALERKQQQRRQ